MPANQVVKILRREERHELLRLGWEREPRVYTVLSCGCRYMATGEIEIGVAVYCSVHKT